MPIFQVGFSSRPLKDEKNRTQIAMISYDNLRLSIIIHHLNMIKYDSLSTRIIKNLKKSAFYFRSCIKTNTQKEYLPLRSKSSLFMISRRNIRIKVMQTLYSLKAYELQNIDEEQKKNMITSAQRQMRQHLEQANQIFIHLLYTLCEIARYADTDARQRASKYLPSEEDLQVNTKIAQNLSILRLAEDQSFNSRVKEVHSKEVTDIELIRDLYDQLTHTPQYQEYISSSNKNVEADKKIIQFLFNELLMKEEAFGQYMEDSFLHWPDDRGMMKILVNNYLNKPWLFNFKQLLSNEKQNYAMELLRTVLDKKPYCLELIRPRLQNWDPDRVAIVDMLLLFMGVCEFLYFPTIPTKVTINEYIDLAKVYSTPQSGQFINGILDNVLKNLQSNHKIHKTERAKK